MNDGRMEDKFTNKLLALVVIIFIFLAAYFLVIGPYLNRHEGDTRFSFFEVSANETFNKSIIHLEDKDITNIRGLDTRFENSKLISIRFDNGENPTISTREFYNKYGSHPTDLSQRKYLEYQGVYYYAVMITP